METEFDSKKFRELILYVAQLSHDDPRFGATKLNKLLFYMDFGSYRLLGSPITGATYQHLPAGPAPRELLASKKFLLDCGDVAIEYRPYFSGTQERLVCQTAPDLSVFSQGELDIVDDVVAEFWRFNARQISEYSHHEAGWLATHDFDDIPYELAWISTEPLTPEQIELGRQVASKVGLLNP